MQWIITFLDKNSILKVGVTYISPYFHTLESQLILHLVHLELIFLGINAPVTMFLNYSEHHRWLNTNLSFLSSF